MIELDSHYMEKLHLDSHYGEATCDEKLSGVLAYQETRSSVNRDEGTLHLV